MKEKQAEVAKVLYEKKRAAFQQASARRPTVWMRDATNGLWMPKSRFARTTNTLSTCVVFWSMPQSITESTHFNGDTKTEKSGQGATIMTIMQESVNGTLLWLG